jgi:branched-chain amino acid transport system substrate-binding protein
MKTYLQQNGDVFGGKKIEIVVKDTTGAAPDIAKRLAQETVTRDNVDILAGFGLTPNALAVAPIATEAKKADGDHERRDIDHHHPLTLYRSLVAHAAAGHPADGAVGGEERHQAVFTWSPTSAGSGRRSAFVKAFKAAGGEIVESVRTPLANPDFAPFIQRVKDAKPEAVFVFLPPGSQTIAFIKGYEERGLKAAGIKIIATGDLTDDGTLQAMGDGTIGIVTSFHYSAAHDSPENKAFLKSYVDTNGPRLRPNFMACAGYDGMAAIAEALKKTQGSTDPDKLLAAFKGMKLMSPRGPITIDADSRDIVQTVYIRRVEKLNGILYNVEFDKFPDVRDPGK